MDTQQFNHLQTIEYDVVIGDVSTPNIAIFNCNKIPTGEAIKCVETGVYNRYVLPMTREQFTALFLDDIDIEEVEVS